MTRYYLAWQFADGSFSEIDVEKPGSPTYRAAMEDAEQIRLFAMQEGAPIKGVRTFLELSSLDLTSRDDYLVMLAYDPVMRTMFDFARTQGGIDVGPTIGQEVVDALRGVVPPTVEELQAATDLTTVVGDVDGIDTRGLVDVELPPIPNVPVRKGGPRFSLDPGESVAAQPATEELVRANRDWWGQDAQRREDAVEYLLELINRGVNAMREQAGNFAPNLEVVWQRVHTELGIIGVDEADLIKAGRPQ